MQHPKGRVPTNWNSRERFMDILKDLDFSSSPGYPYMREAPTIGQWLKTDEVSKFDPVQVERLWYDTQKVMAGTYDHYFRAFVKDEPHKKAKAEQNRWRLIIATSLPVQMVWRMLYTEQNDAMNKLHKYLPSKHGFVFCYGGWMDFVAEAKTKGLNVSRDISGWDVGAPGWVFKVVGALRENWGGVTPSWIRVHRLMYKDAYSESKILFSNGIVVQQEYDGFMKSGLFNTITDNSLSMGGIHGLACKRSGLPFGRYVVTGDDIVQSHVNEAYLEELYTLGCRVKEVLHHLEFMGINFSSGKPEPMYTQKHLYNMTVKGEYIAEVLDAYCRYYAESRKYGLFEEVARQLGVPIRSRWYYKFWYSSPLAATYYGLA
uniref:RNA-dependent RNA polymerase n=1 Tax=Pyongtaek Culex luteo-like virus TaxID=2902640 RepID=A0A8K1U1W9_9LUTE|nr:MAG: RNA-dependent RNA polymerase [Pyongtaek Culex luteo-like virus]